MSGVVPPEACQNPIGSTRNGIAGKNMGLCTIFGLMVELQSPSAATSRLIHIAAKWNSHNMVVVGGHVLDQAMRTLGLDSESAEERRMPECVCIANRYEHTAEVAPLMVHAIFHPELLERPTGCWKICQPPCQQCPVDDGRPSRPRKGGQLPP